MRHEELRDYFAFAYFSLLYFQHLTLTRQMPNFNSKSHQLDRSDSSPLNLTADKEETPFRNKVASQICLTLKQKFNKEI